MLKEHEHLLARLECFDLDRRVSAAFTARLARENAWTRAHAERVCREYKRFVFLAVAAGHPCTPSEQVDQVWHLHLVHTKAYWQSFCDEVLRTPLHHEPTRGGVVERAKFHDWYARTLASYRVAFGAEPPSDIWPAPVERFAPSPVRIDRARHWLVPKPRGWSSGVRLMRACARTATAPAMLGLAALSVLLSGCAWVHRVPPFDLHGGAFLTFFVALWAVSMLVVAWLKRQSRSVRDEVTDLDAYQTAYLAGGHVAATDAAIATLVESGCVEVDLTTQRLRAKDPGNPFCHALERALLERCASWCDGARVADLRKIALQHAVQLRPPLERAGLLFTRERIHTFRLIALAAPALGVIKVGVGLALDKPVGFLIMLCIASVLFAFGMAKRVHTTAAGDALLERLRLIHPLVRDASGRAAPSPSMPIALAVALFGTAVLSATALAEMAPLLAGSPSGSGGGGCSSDGDGGGCGGDGGCGGCGGCGGE